MRKLGTRGENVFFGNFSESAESCRSLTPDVGTSIVGGFPPKFTLFHSRGNTPTGSAIPKAVTTSRNVGSNGLREQGRCYVGAKFFPALR